MGEFGELRLSMAVSTIDMLHKNADTILTQAEHVFQASSFSQVLFFRIILKVRVQVSGLMGVYNAIYIHVIIRFPSIPQFYRACTFVMDIFLEYVS